MPLNPNPNPHSRKSDTQIAQELSAALGEQDALRHILDLRTSQLLRAERRINAAKQKVEALRSEQASRKNLKEALDKLARFQAQALSEAEREQERLEAKLSGTLLIEAFRDHTKYVVRNVHSIRAGGTSFRADFKTLNTLALPGSIWRRGSFVEAHVIEKIGG